MPRSRSSGTPGSTSTVRPRRSGDWRPMAEWYAEDATYGWMYTPDEHFMAVGRDQIRDWAIGIEMDGFDGWHYDYQATVIDEKKGMMVGFWKQRSGIIDDETGKEYEILGIGGSGSASSVRSATARADQVRVAARLVRHAVDRAHVRGDRQGRTRRPTRLLERMQVSGHERARPLPPQGHPVDPCGRRRSSAATTSPSRRRRRPPHDDLASARAAADRRQARRRVRRRDVPDPQPGHRCRRSGTRPTAPPPTSTRRSPRPGGPSTRPTGRRTSSCGCAACASCTRRCSTTPTRSRR